jgi:hypothetical protein
MSDEWPRRYTSAELEAIAKSIGQSKLKPFALDKLQEAAEAYQWGRLVDDRISPSSTNKGRRKSLKHIIALVSKRRPQRRSN